MTITSVFTASVLGSFSTGFVGSFRLFKGELRSSDPKLFGPHIDDSRSENHVISIGLGMQAWQSSAIQNQFGLRLAAIDDIQRPLPMPLE